MTWLNTFKFNVFTTFRQAGLVGVLIDPKVDGVTVPEDLRGSHRVLLHIGDRLTDGSAMPVPVHDLEAGIEEGVSVTLSFNRTPFRVGFPWAAVLAMGVVGSDLFCQFHGQIVTAEPPEQGPAPEGGGKVISFPGSNGRLTN